MIELRRVSVVYPNGVTALQPTSLTFERGLFHVILGPSGAGKSTLLRSMNGLVAPSQGEVFVPGQGVLRGARILREHRRRSAMIFQRHHLLPRLTVLANVLHGRLGYHSVWRTLLPPSLADRRLALEALSSVGLIEKALERADQLSVGQQQRVGLARALTQEPELLLADEPIASLDPATAEQAMDLIAGICRRRGITAIVSLHQVELARAFADRIIGLTAGRVVFDGLSENLTPDVLKRIYGTAGEPSNSVTSLPNDLSNEVPSCTPVFDPSSL